METTAIISPIYKGNRDQDFENLITKILKLGKLKKEYVSLLIQPQNLAVYNQVFTAPSADPTNNYESLEILGDATINNAVVYYVSRRFPQLRCPEGVKVVARLKINLVSKQTFFEIAQGLGFFPFITASEENRASNMKPLLEDCFEAFFGATVSLLDEQVMLGVGYAITYDIIAALLDKINISLRYEDLYDAKTRLKETFDWMSQLGQPKYMNSVTTNESGHRLNTVTVYRNIQQTGQKILIGTGVGALKATAEQNAAEDALNNLARQNIKKPIPAYYQSFC